MTKILTPSFSSVSFVSVIGGDDDDDDDGLCG